MILTVAAMYLCKFILSKSDYSKNKMLLVKFTCTDAFFYYDHVYLVHGEGEFLLIFE